MSSKTIHLLIRTMAVLLIVCALITLIFGCTKADAQFKKHNTIKTNPEMQGPFKIAETESCRLYVIYYKGERLYWTMCNSNHNASLTK